MEQPPPPLTKEEKELNRQLSQHVDRYSHLRDWSELALWLTKLKAMISEYKGTIIDKNSVLKKLSTSLNASLPAALHESTLEIYEIMMSKFIALDNLEYVCLGLFSFFSSSNMKCKIRLVEIFKTHLPKFGHDISAMGTGILITFLPSLTEMHENLIKETNELLEQLASPDSLGLELFIECIWISILRSTNCRIPGLKYISLKLGKVEDDEENDEEDNFWNETISISHGKKEEVVKEVEEENTVTKKIEIIEYCPHLETLVTNALIACIEDQNILITKTSLDFLYKYLPLKSEILSHESKSKLAHSIIWLLGKRDMGVTRKINLWLFGKLDSNNKFIVTPKYLDFIVEPIINFLRKDSSLEPLKIIFNLFNEHEELPALTMQKLTKEIVSFCTRQENDQEAIKLVQRLLDKIHYELSVLSNSLGIILIEAVNNKDFREAEHILQLTVYLVRKILRPNEIKIIIFFIIKTIVRSYQLTEWFDRDYMKSALSVTLQLIESYKDILKSEDNKEIYESDKELLHNITLYTKLLEKLKNSEADLTYEQEIHSISKSQVKFYEVFEIYQKEWVDILVKNVYLKLPQYYLTPIEVIGEGLEKEGKLRNEIMKRVEEGNDEWIRIAIEKMWGIMSFGHLHSKVIPLLLRLIKFFPHFFTAVLTNDFKFNVEIAITKFSVFWNLSPKYSSIVSHQHLSEICKSGFFQMLNFLDNGNPLVKYNTKIWINDCFPNFSRVVDPLLENILQPNGCWYRTMKGQFVYAISPDYEKVSSCVRYLHSIVKHTEKNFFKFSLKPISTNLVPYYDIFKGNSEGNENPEPTYISLIFEIIIRYLSTKELSYHENNSGLDIMCCEFLETLVKKIPDPDTCLKCISENIYNIFLSLHFATCNKEHILQIQLLNLIDAIFFNSELKNASDSKHNKLKVIISSSYFIKTILEGLNTEFPYIKERFVEFINKSIILFLDYYSNCSELISQILNNYSSKIMLVHSHKLESSEHKDIEISKRNSEILIMFGGVTELLSYFLNLHIKPFEKEKNHLEPDSGVFSLYTWKSYVSLKIERKAIESNKARKNAEEISRLMPNELEQLLLTMTTCWTLSDLVPHYKISFEGLSEFNFEDFHTFNKQLYQTLGHYETEESVETYIINLLRVLLNKYPREIMNGMVKNWTSANTIEQKIKIIEILNMTSIPIENFYAIMSESLNADKLHKKKKSIHLIFEQSVELEILHFCQFFTHYNFQNFSVFQSANLLNIWVSFLKFIKLFENSRSVLTLYAVLELIHLFIQKYSPKEIIKDEKIRKELLLITNSFQELVMICNGKIKISAAQTSPIVSYTIHDFLPFPTSVFEVYMSELGKIEEAKVPYMYFNQLTPESSLIYCRVYAFLIFKRISYQFLQVFYGDSEANLVKKTREVFIMILSVVEDKSQNSIFIDCASEATMNIIEKRHSFAKELKNDVLEIFNKDDFFICSSKTLHCWVKIIDMIVDNNKDHDIFTEYLEKVSLASSIFSSYNLETKKKIKSFERICFILYSGKKDKYNEKAHLLVDKIIEVIKNTEAPQPVLILIFFCIRILILRTSPERLTKLLANMWQMVMFLLSNIFRKSQESLKEKNGLNLLWAALKLIEMVSIMELNEFHPHQWIFFYDFIGIKFEPVASSCESKEAYVNPKIKPLISRYLPQELCPFKDTITKESEIGHLIIKEDKIDDVEILKTKALLLSLYLVRNNQCKMKFKMEEIEMLIENDFLNLDEFIFKLK